MQRPGRHPMQIYLETANPDELREAMAWRVVDGVFTDPALLAREGKESTALIRELVELVPGPVAVEVTSFGTEEIVEEARMLSSLHDRILVRVPCVPAGIPAIAALADERIAVDASLCFSVPQALLAAKAGASLISPQVSEMDDAGGDGLSLVSSIMTMLDQFDLKSGVIAGAVRSVGQVAELARMGADGVALSLGLLRELAEHPLSESVRRERLDHWRQAQN
jgi:transaldolase